MPFRHGVDIRSRIAVQYQPHTGAQDLDAKTGATRPRTMTPHQIIRESSANGWVCSSRCPLEDRV